MTGRPTVVDRSPAAGHLALVDVDELRRALQAGTGAIATLIGRLGDSPDFLTEVDFAGWNHAQDAGRPFAQAVAEQAARFPHRRELLAAYQDRFAETLGGPIEGSVEILQELRERPVRLLALTNWSAETFPVARDSFAFLQAFEGIVVSGEEGVAKPDPEVFEIVLRRYDVDPARAVYVDDSPRNVAAAAELGLTALHFTGAHALRAELVDLGLLPALP